MDDYTRERILHMILHMILAALMVSIALGLFLELRASSAGSKTLIKEASDNFVEYSCGTITSCEGEFLVVDKYTETTGLLSRNTVYKVVLEDSSKTRYVVEVSEIDYANLDIQEKISAEFQSHEMGIPGLYGNFHLIRKINDTAD